MRSSGQQNKLFWICLREEIADKIITCATKLLHCHGNLPLNHIIYSDESDHHYIRKRVFLGYKFIDHTGAYVNTNAMCYY